MRKAQLLCLVNEIPETHHNVEAIFEILALEEVMFKVATDFKLLNLMLGISVSYWNIILYSNPAIKNLTELFNFIHHFQIISFIKLF